MTTVVLLAIIAAGEVLNIVLSLSYHARSAKWEEYCKSRDAVATAKFDIAEARAARLGERVHAFARGRQPPKSAAPSDFPGPTSLPHPDSKATGCTHPDSQHAETGCMDPDCACRWPGPTGAAAPAAASDAEALAAAHRYYDKAGYAADSWARTQLVEPLARCLEDFAAARLAEARALLRDVLKVEATHEDGCVCGLHSLAYLVRAWLAAHPGSGG